jgi:endogenous inhibitor of DNA gyrase (YacG/DUF329 family)
MQKYPIDQNVRGIWKIYPVRILGGSLSSCHSKPTLLVQSMEGGFVTRNCPACGSREPLPQCTFLHETDLWVACPHCRGQMAREIVDRNYAFVCDKCQIFIDLADLLPRWSKI